MGWRKPTTFPDLTQSQYIAIDTETKDPDIKKMGPGWATGNGHIVGVSVATDSFSGYYPIRHPSGNMDERVVFSWLREQLKTDTPKVFANALYDAGWLDYHGVKINGPWYDVQVAAPLIDEHRPKYNLDSLGADYVGDLKTPERMNTWCEIHKKKGDPRAWIWQMPAAIVGEYAEQDAVLTLKVWKKLKPLIVSEGLSEVFDVETRLLPMLLAMRKLGVRVDLNKANQLRDELERKEKLVLKAIDREVGRPVNIYSAKSLQTAYDAINLPYPKTAKGNASFTRQWLETSKDPISPLILQARKYQKTKSTFLEGSILKYNHKGRIHCCIHSLRGDEYGTVSGRCSSSNPNIQQIPSRDPDIGPLIRGLFIPEDGTQWGCFDYSQQEPRLAVHYASLCNLEGSEEALRYYRGNPDADFYDLIVRMAGITRPQAKVVFLGVMYGMGKAKLADGLGLEVSEAEELLSKFHEKVPFVRGLSWKCSQRSEHRGFISTLLGRRCRFPLFEPRDFGHGQEAVSKEQAIENFRQRVQYWVGGYKRAFTYKSLNRLIQGSAADQTKKAMVDAWEAGFTPHFPVHDEINQSIESEKKALELKDIMENAVSLSVPSKVDMGLGANWSEAK